MLPRVPLLGLAIACLSSALTAAPESLRVFYFGNSLTQSSMPAWHDQLGRSVGKQWTTETMLGAGWQPWQHREQLLPDGVSQTASSKGDLTIDPAVVKAAPFAAKKYFNREWDAIVVQVFGRHLVHRTRTMHGTENFKEEKDVGDIAAISDLVRIQLGRNPASRIYLYQVWPPMLPGQPRDGLRGAEFPRREIFDYHAQWAQEHDAKQDPKGPLHSPHRTKDFNERVWRGVRDVFPELHASGRLQLIPAGDLFATLDRSFRAQPELGVADIRDFYADVQHIRFGLPRYTVAALFYAVLFEADPEGLDWKIYNDRAPYGADPHLDGGELLEITPERMRVVHAAIRQVLGRPAR